MLNFEQEEALNIAISGHNLLICGQAGTGKTHLMKQVVKTLKQQQKNVSLLCTTGMGCLQYSDMAATTVHSWSGLYDGRYDRLTLENLLLNDDNYSKVRQNVQKCDTVIIDEISMLSMKQFEDFEMICRVGRGKSAVFGGLQIILCGDFYQLPPVGNSLCHDNGNFCFESDLFNTAITHYIKLVKVMRQDNTLLIQAVRQTAVGGVSDDTDQFLSALQRPLSEDSTHLFARNIDATIFNNNCLSNLNTESRTYKATKNIGTVKYLNKILACHYLNVKINCPVVLLCNLGGKLVNGLSGFVTKLDDNCIHVNFLQIKETHEIRRHLFTTYSSSKKCNIAEREQFPLMLGYGLTIHKTQGMTLNHVTVHCQGIFQAGQLSVAIGRAVSSEGLSLLYYRKGLCKQPSPKITEFYGRATKPFLTDLTCCNTTRSVTPDHIFETGTQYDSENSDFDEEDLISIEQLSSEEPESEVLPNYINVKKLKMHCYTENPITRRQKSINNLCENFDDLKLLNFCHTQFKRIEELLSATSAEKTTKPKEWTELLGLNHSYITSDDFKMSVRKLYCSVNLCDEQLHVASTIVLEILKSAVHHLASKVTVATEQSSTSSVEISEAGKAKIRYVGGMCVAKIKNHYISMVIRNQNNPNKHIQKQLKQSEEKVQHLNCLIADESLDLTDKSLEEIERKQNVRRALTYISDLTYSFFLHLNFVICQFLTTENFISKQSNIFNYTLSKIENNEDLQMLFSELCPNATDSSTVTSLYKELLHKYLMVCHKQFLKDTKDSLNIVKKKAHREEITKKAEKRKSEVKLSIKDIVSDTSDQKDSSHMKLKLNCLANEKYFTGTEFTKKNIFQLYDAYGIPYTSTTKKQDLAATLRQTVITSNKISNPESLTSQYVQPSTSTGKRAKTPSKGKGKGKGKGKTKIYTCNLCKEPEIDGEEWIQCDNCNSWVHRTCDGVDDDQWEELQEEGTEWLCSECSAN